MSRSYVSLPAITFTGFLYGLAPTGSGAVVSQAAGIEIDDFSYLDTSGEPSTGHQEKLLALIRRILFERRYTYRGDNDEAWGRAEIFVSREFREKLAGSPPTSQVADREPTNLAVFAFELEDTSAGAPSISESAADAADATELTKVTDAVRKMLAESPRYRVIDVAGAKAEAVKARALHDCSGCDAAIALDLGADQSLVGVIRRVSRTEYTVRFWVREARTGAVVANADSGLRMGANYSWSRGAVRLVSDRLLETQSQQ